MSVGPDPARRRFLRVGAGLPILAVGSITPSAQAGTVLESSPEPTGSAARIGLALGSGGARGLAHLAVFELLDELGIRPHRISGSSIGALLGALYAAGLSGREIRDDLEGLTLSRDEPWYRTLMQGEWRALLGFIDLSRQDGGVIESEGLTRFFEERTGAARFQDLRVPLQVIATDYMDRLPVVIGQGPLWPAIQASIALPGLFTPTTLDGRILVDGGLTNPVPFDTLFADCDFIIAVNVLGTRRPEDDASLMNPTYFENIFNTFQVMQYSILRQMVQRRAPQVLLSPEIRDIRVLDFHRMSDVLEQSQPAIAELRSLLLSLDLSV